MRSVWISGGSERQDSLMTCSSISIFRATLDVR